MSAHISKEVILSDIKEWRDWIYQLEVYARGKEVWDYIKPTSDKLVEPTQPKRPEMIEMRGEEETAEDFRLRIELYRIEMENYKFDYESFREVKKGLAEVHSYIYSTIERGNAMYFRGETTVSGIVAKLKARFAMNPGLERWLVARHRLLLTPRRGTKPESFLPVSYDIN